MRCVVCGCTDDNACVAQFSPHEEPTRCEWVHAEGEPPLCSFCERDDTLYEDVDEKFDDVVWLGDEEPRLILPGDPEFHL